MSSKLNAFLLAGALTLLPTCAMAEISLADMVEDASFTIDESLMLDQDMDIARGHGGPGPRPHAGPGPRPNHGHAAPPPPRHHTTVKHYRTNVRPRHVVQPVVVAAPSTVVVENANHSPKLGSTFGFGLRGAGSTTSYFDYSDVNAGIGYYIKYRPSRWISIEFINDYLFTTSSSEDYVKIPLSLGLRAHIFDYGSLDAYGVAAAAINSITNFGSGHDNFLQFGGQFGAGVSLIAGVFEIGVDCRYTVDTTFKAFDHGLGNQMDYINHGVNFSLNIGFAL